MQRSTPKFNHYQPAGVRRSHWQHSAQGQHDDCLQLVCQPLSSDPSEISGPVGQQCLEKAPTWVFNLVSQKHSTGRWVGSSSDWDSWVREHHAWLLG